MTSTSTKSFVLRPPLMTDRVSCPLSITCREPRAWSPSSMPKYSFECPTHGEFEIAVPVSAHRDHWPCPSAKCKAVTEQTYTPEKPKTWSIAPVVVHVGAGGKVRFPGRSDAKVPRGFNKVELKTLPEIENFERESKRHL